MQIGVVAIGRNEGERLAACLASAVRSCEFVVYVDSGSTDGSVALATSMGVNVVELDLSVPFTAARARNEGFAKLKSIAAVDAVQFVDGDCEIVPGWIDKAVVFLGSNPGSAVVCGRRRERFPDASVYNKLADMEWNSPVGTVKSCGGDSLIRVAAFDQVSGYDRAVIAGEEPEMCVRLRAAGWTIHRIDAEMTLHDAAMTRFGQWWKRTVRGGYAYALANAMHGGPPEFFRVREIRRILLWGVWLNMVSIGGFCLLSLFTLRWGWLGLIPLAAYPMNALRTAAGRRKRGDPGRTYSFMGCSSRWEGSRSSSESAGSGTTAAADGGHKSLNTRNSQMIRTKNTRRRYGSTLIVWGLVVWIVLLVRFTPKPILNFFGPDGEYADDSLKTVSWPIATVVIAVVIAAGFLLRSPLARANKDQ